MSYTKEKIKRTIDKAYEANKADTTIAYSTLALAMMMYNQENRK